MKKQFLSILAAGLMLGGALQTKAMDNVASSSAREIVKLLVKAKDLMSPVHFKVSE